MVGGLLGIVLTLATVCLMLPGSLSGYSELLDLGKYCIFSLYICLNMGVSGAVIAALKTECQRVRCSRSVGDYALLVETFRREKRLFEPVLSASFVTLTISLVDFAYALVMAAQGCTADMPAATRRNLAMMSVGSCLVCGFTLVDLGLLAEEGYTVWKSAMATLR